jgi:hypothetical protein
LPLDPTTLPSEEDVIGLDPDNPVDDRTFVGKLTITARVDVGAGTVVPSYGAEDNERILTTCRNFFAKFGYQHAAWYLEAEGISVVRTDGLPFRQHEILKLQTNEGRNLGKNMAHARLSAAFLELGVSASYAKAGQPDSAYGRIIEFGTEEIKLGKSFTKGLRLFPRQLFPEGYVYDGEVREVTPRSQDDVDEGVPADGGAQNGHISEEEATSILREVLTGRTPAQMLDAVLSDPRLKTVPSVFGVPLVESATDESLATVLQENKVMAINGSGVLVPV